MSWYHHRRRRDRRSRAYAQGEIARPINEQETETLSETNDRAVQSVEIIANDTMNQSDPQCTCNLRGWGGPLEGISPVNRNHKAVEHAIDRVPRLEKNVVPNVIPKVVSTVQPMQRYQSVQNVEPVEPLYDYAREEREIRLERDRIESIQNQLRSLTKITRHLVQDVSRMHRQHQISQQEKHPAKSARYHSGFHQQAERLNVQQIHSRRRDLKNDLTRDVKTSNQLKLSKMAKHLQHSRTDHVLQRSAKTIRKIQSHRERAKSEATFRKRTHNMSNRKGQSNPRGRPNFNQEKSALMNELSGVIQRINKQSNKTDGNFGFLDPKPRLRPVHRRGNDKKSSNS